MAPQWPLPMWATTLDVGLLNRKIPAKKLWRQRMPRLGIER